MNAAGMASASFPVTGTDLNDLAAVAEDMLNGLAGANLYLYTIDDIEPLIIDRAGEAHRWAGTVNATIRLP